MSNTRDFEQHLDAAIRRIGQTREDSPRTSIDAAVAAECRSFGPNAAKALTRRNVEPQPIYIQRRPTDLTGWLLPQPYSRTSGFVIACDGGVTNGYVHESHIEVNGFLSSMMGMAFAIDNNHEIMFEYVDDAEFLQRRPLRDVLMEGLARRIAEND